MKAKRGGKCPETAERQGEGGQRQPCVFGSRGFCFGVVCVREHKSKQEVTSLPANLFLANSVVLYGASVRVDGPGAVNHVE